MRARRPISRTASKDLPLVVMSATVVMPLATASIAPMRAEASQSSSVKKGSVRKTARFHFAYGKSSNMPRNAEKPRCVCKSTKPGMSAACPKSRTSSSGCARRSSAAGPTPAMRSPSTSTAPSSM
jgi:hypothetical protein